MRVHQPLIIRLLPILLLAGVIYSLLDKAQAAVGLIFFDAQSEAEVVKIEWHTAYETDTAGYEIERDDVSGAISVEYEGQTTSFIPSSAENVFGAIYIAYDKQVSPGKTYTYRLYEIAQGTARDELQSVTVTVEDNNDGVVVVNPAPASLKTE